MSDRRSLRGGRCTVTRSIEIQVLSECSGAIRGLQIAIRRAITRTSTLIFSLLPTGRILFPATRAVISPAFPGQLPDLVQEDRSAIRAWNSPAFDFVAPVNAFRIRRVALMVRTMGANQLLRMAFTGATKSKPAIPGRGWRNDLPGRDRDCPGNAGEITARVAGKRSAAGGQQREDKRRCARNRGDESRSGGLLSRRNIRKDLYFD